MTPPYVYLWEGMRHRVPLWPPIIASLLIGVSSALPLFLFLCEGRIQPSTRL